MIATILLVVAMLVFLAALIDWNIANAPLKMMAVGLFLCTLAYLIGGAVGR